MTPVKAIRVGVGIKKTILKNTFHHGATLLNKSKRDSERQRVQADLQVQAVRRVGQQGHALGQPLQHELHAAANRRRQNVDQDDTALARLRRDQGQR